ncbi:MAG: hypothetical protein PHH60_03850 [Candidatus Margulisbacteria bacterium]|nr:hypothetical protein [Candidatus Margulisiibacteriota bacterium]
MLGIGMMEITFLLLILAFANYLRISAFRMITSNKQFNPKLSGMIAIEATSLLIVLTFMYFLYMQGALGISIVEQLLAQVPLQKIVVFLLLLILDLELIWLGVTLLTFRPETGRTGIDKVRLLPAVWIIFSIMMVAVAVVFIFGPQLQQNRILENGLPGQAEVLNIAPTGVLVNDQPRCKLDLKVTTASGEVYETTLFMVISPVYLPQFQPGANLNIRYDRQNKKEVAVESIIRK